jgi:hypothetical protein
MLRKLAVLPIAVLLATATASAEVAATKTEEAARFHPPARGMSAATRLAGQERRLAMEKATTRLVVKAPKKEAAGEEED